MPALKRLVDLVGKQRSFWLQTEKYRQMSRRRAQEGSRTDFIDGNSDWGYCVRSAVYAILDERAIQFYDNWVDKTIRGRSLFGSGPGLEFFELC